MKLTTQSRIEMTIPIRDNVAKIIQTVCLRIKLLYLRFMSDRAVLTIEAMHENISETTETKKQCGMSI
jgi:hypothetical protein